MIENRVGEVLMLAEKLPAGLNDPRSVEKLMAERQELLDALADGDYAGALTEGADAVYYAAKHLDWVARQLEVTVDQLFGLAFAKYDLRARPGNPKDDAAEREACLLAID